MLSGLTDWLGSAPKITLFRNFGNGAGPPHLHQAHLVGHFGPLYGVMFAVMLAAAIGGLLARYRKVGIA